MEERQRRLIASLWRIARNLVDGLLDLPLASHFGHGGEPQVYFQSVAPLNIVITVIVHVLAMSGLPLAAGSPCDPIVAAGLDVGDFFFSVVIAGGVMEGQRIVLRSW